MKDWAISLLLSLRQTGTHKLWQNRKDKCYNDIKPDPSPSCLPLVQLKWGGKKVSKFWGARHPALKLDNATATDRR